jgi:hypothetical protein
MTPKIFDIEKTLEDLTYDSFLTPLRVNLTVT